LVESATTAAMTSLVILEAAGVLHLAGAMIAVMMAGDGRTVSLELS
jgi:hypothetical protein